MLPDLRNDVRASFLSWLASAEADREEGYRVAREYYDGDHETQLTDRMRKFLQIKTSQDFRSNYCPIVVDALAERLVVTGFECESQDETLWSWWTVNRMDGVQGVVHTGAVRDGDTYVLVEWDDEKRIPVMFFEPAFDGGEGVKVIYDEATNRPRLASKRWRIQTGEGAGYVRRMNLYYPDRVEKYVSNDREFEGAWQLMEQPAPWVDGNGRPLGMPVMHFKNNDQGYHYGQSELKNVIPLQDGLNKTVIDLLAAADTTAFRIYWMVGDDPSGVSVAPGSWVYTNHPSSGEDSASLGYFPGEDLGNLISLKDSIAIEIARVSRTPVSYFQVSGQRPAEGTLKQEEAGLVGKARNRQVSFGNAWEDVMSLARRLWNTFGPGPEMDESVAIRAVWRDAETRNDESLLKTLQIKSQLGVPKEKLWAEMGYNADEIAEMGELEEAAAERQANVGLAMMDAFERAGGRPAQGMGQQGQMPGQMPGRTRRSAPTADGAQGA